MLKVGLLVVIVFHVTTAAPRVKNRFYFDKNFHDRHRPRELVIHPGRKHHPLERLLADSSSWSSTRKSKVDYQVAVESAEDISKEEENKIKEIVKFVLNQMDSEAEQKSGQREKRSEAALSHKQTGVAIVDQVTSDRVMGGRTSEGAKMKTFRVTAVPKGGEGKV